MIPIIALALAPFAPLAPDAYLTGIAIMPAGDRTEIVVEVQGEVNVTDFVLESPARLVLDFSGIGTVSSVHGSVERGGIRAVRVAQFSPTVARVVIDLDAPVEYRVNRGEGHVRVSFPNPGSEFEPWTAGPIAGA